LFKKHTIDIEKINWEYVHTLYFISHGKSIEPAVVERCKKNRLNKVTMVMKKTLDNTKKGLEISPENSESFGKLIGDIAGQVAKSLEGKDLTNLNPQDLLTGMMSGNMNIGGINFQEILDNSTKNFQTKVDSGEIDVADFSKQAQDMMGKLNLHNEPKFEEVD